MMDKPHDDLEAVRIIVNTLEGFPPSEQERIIRWAKEKLGLGNEVLKPDSKTIQSPQTMHHTDMTIQPKEKMGSNVDVKTFVVAKAPPSDTQFAATVAYYYKFEAPLDKQKEFITSEILQEACRLASRNRLNDPGHTLRDAHRAGYLDKGPDRGTYKINTVGENLVAMTLPSGMGVQAKRTTKKKIASKSEDSD